ncbi:MAG: dephospho-CoA kinase [Candidatus Melainabacteria bacterium]|nr:MAG: dephospho-CoA kinase [Candidatus Melainabacteria bacterium]
MGKLYHGLTTIGITGTIGAGKSTVGKILEDLGIPVIDSDQIVHNLLAEDAEVQNLIVDRFGNSVVLQNSTSPTRAIDRKALGQVVFKNTQKRALLEEILHPRVRSISRQKIEQLANDPSVKLVACLVPLLFEANLGDEYDETWTVITEPTVLKDRLKRRDHLSPSEVEGRLASQWSQEKKASLADKVIDNSADLSQTRKQVVDLIDRLIPRQAR